LRVPRKCKGDRNEREKVGHVRIARMKKGGKTKKGETGWGK